MYTRVFIAGLLYGYYLGFFENYFTNDGNISLLLTTTETQPVQYFVEAPGVGYYYNGTVSVDNEVILNLPSSVEVSSIYDQNKGVYLTTSSDSITVIGQNLDRRTGDSFFALPTMELSDINVYYGISVPRATVHSEPLTSSILIVGRQNNTMTTLTVTQYVSISVSNTITYLTPGREYSFVINRLQTVFVGSAEDLSGTKIVVNKPVSVFSGHKCANVPRNVTACSYLVEQIPPTALWGNVYYTAPLANKRSYTIKILATYNSTAVNIYCNNTMEAFIISEGQSVNKRSQMNEYCAIYSHKVVLVAQFGHGGTEDNGYGDPLMTLVPAAHQYLNKFEFSTIRNPRELGYDHYVNIIVKEQYYQPNMIYLIAEGVNRSLVTQQWVPIQVNNTIGAYATQVSIPEGIAQVFHTNPAAEMMTIVYGFNDYDGYGHIGGIRLSTGC